MKTLRKILNGILNILAGGSLVAMVVLTTYQVVTRYVFSAPSTWSEELVGYLFAWSTLFGAAVVSGERGHMNIPVIVERFSPLGQKVLNIFSEIIALVFSAAILVYGGITVSQLAMGQQTSSLGVAVGVFYWVMPLCGVVMVLYAALNIIGIAKGEISLAASDEASEAIAKVEAERKA